jgi:hypothetical protein
VRGFTAFPKQKVTCFVAAKDRDASTRSEATLHGHHHCSQEEASNPPKRRRIARTLGFSYYRYHSLTLENLSTKGVEQNRYGFLALEFSLSDQRVKVCLIRVCLKFQWSIFFEGGSSEFYTAWLQRNVERKVDYSICIPPEKIVFIQLSLFILWLVS